MIVRREDRAMSREFGLEIIDKASYGTLCLADEEGLPYGVPLSLARDGEKLYFHSAKAGKKVDLIKDGSQIAVVFVGEHQVPSVMDSEQVRKASESPKTFHLLTSKIFTTEFESAMVHGIIRRLTDEEQKIRGLRVICEKFTPQWMEYFEEAIASGLKVTDVYEIRIIDLTAKRKKFDASGEEMKWQRMS